MAFTGKYTQQTSPEFDLGLPIQHFGADIPCTTGTFCFENKVSMYLIQTPTQSDQYKL